MNNLVKIGLGIAVAIIFPLMVGLGIEAFYPSPKMAYDVCLDKMPAYKEGSKAPEADPTYKKCLDDQNKIVDAYNRNVFIMTAIIGFVAIAIGALYSSEEFGPVGPGLVFGGLFTILYGATRSFTAVDKRWLFLELGLGLIGL